MPNKLLRGAAPDAAPAPSPDRLRPEAASVTAALTRSSTGAEDLRQLEAGLDSLQSDSVRRARIDWSRVLLPVAALAVLLVAWQVYVWLGIKRRDLVPGPLDVIGQLGTLWGEAKLQEAVWTSLQRGIAGFLVSVAIATPVGLLLAQVAPLRRAFGPLISGLQSLPSVAWVPAAIIWFGLTDAAIYMVVLFGAVPSIANGLVSGMKQVPPLFDRVGRVLGLSALGRIRYVLLPAALPGYLGGLRQGWAFAWRSLMAAELITYSPSLGQGLGQLLNIGRELSQMSLVITSIMLILVVGMAIELLVFAPIERRVLVRRGLTIR